MTLKQSFDSNTTVTWKNRQLAIVVGQIIFVGDMYSVFFLVDDMTYKGHLKVTVRAMYTRRVVNHI